MYQSKKYNNFFFLIPQPAQAWIALFLLILFTVASVMAGFGTMFNFAFPAGACAVGLLLYTRYPILYVGFVWWLWFLTPLVRRLADYTSSSFTDPSPILLSPYLVVFITFETFWKHLPKTRREGTLPFLLCLSSLFYSFALGLVCNPLQGAVIDFLDWCAPVLFGFYLFINWRNYPSYRQNIQRVFFWGVLVMGVYGIIQYLILPEWDRFWIIQSEMASAGTPERFLLNVHSTMNSRGPFALFMMVGLLLLLNNTSSLKGFFSFFVGPIGYLALLLTRVRAIWVAFIIGLLFLWSSLKPHLKIRLILTFTVMVLCLLPLINMEQFFERISERSYTVFNLREDNSFESRQEIYKRELTKALFSLVGRGMGGGIGDSGFLSLLFTFGWIGVIFYCSGLLMLIFTLFQGFKTSSDQFASTARAIIMSLLPIISLGNPMAGLGGIVFWSFLGIGIAAQKYHNNKRYLIKYKD